MMPKKIMTSALATATLMLAVSAPVLANAEDRKSVV